MSDCIKSLDLESRYDVLSLNVISSSQISDRTSLVIKHLTTSKDDTVKAPLCVLRAKAAVASKLISITEIAKRELRASNGKIYQYNDLSSELVTRNTRLQNGTQKAAEGLGEDGKEEVAFQVMPEKEKVRLVPMVTIYLAIKSVKELKTALAEQKT